MLQRLSPYQHSETPFRSTDRGRAVYALHAPSKNHLLAALPQTDYQRLLQYLEPVPLPLGWTVQRASGREKHLYFPTAGIVSLSCMMKNGASAEFSLTGSEGVIGVASILGGESTPNQAVVLSAGYAYRLSASLVRDEFEHFGPLARMLLRYTQALITQTGQTAVCNRHHTLEQQLCRWLLTCLDRSPSSDLTMTQERIADMLGVRRESITEAAGKLQKAGLIVYHRGHIAVLGRAKLEAQVCECYAVIKREYERLLPNTGRTQDEADPPLRNVEMAGLTRPAAGDVRRAKDGLRHLMRA